MTGAGPGSSRPSSDADVSWEFGPPRGYATQKSVLFVVGATEMVVKQSRDALGAERLAVEIDALRQLHARSLTGDPDDQVVVPEVLADHRSPGRTVVAESSLAGDSLLDHLSAGGRATDAAPLVDFLIGLAIESAADTDSGARSAAFGSVADRFATTFPLHRRTAARVRAAAARIVDVGVPSVQLHGDFTPWNVVRTEAGWAVHDWENADPAGPPLWDLVLLMIGVAGAVERSADLRRLVEGLTASGPTHDVLAEWTGRYCAAVGVEPALVPDLWVTLLAHQAVKEASRSRRLRTIRVRSLRLLVSLDRPANLPGGRTA